MNGRLLKSNKGGVKKFFANEFVKADDDNDEDEEEGEEEDDEEDEDNNFNVRDALNLNKVIEIEGDIATPANIQPTRNLATTQRAPVRPADERYNIVPTAPIGSRTRGRLESTTPTTTTTPTKTTITPTKTTITPTKATITPTKTKATITPTKTKATTTPTKLKTITKITEPPRPTKRIQVGNYLVDETPTVRNTRSKSATIGGKIIFY